MKTPQFIKKISKRAYAFMAIAVATIAVPAALYAWGPSTRATFTLANPAQYVTFNSITDNKEYGDERDFVQVRNVTDNTDYSNDTTLVPGKEYEVFAYFHNNASTSLNDAAHNYAGVAKDAFMRTQMPATVDAGGEARITSFVGASNAKHLNAAGTDLGNQVWDEAYAKNSTNGAVALNYVAGSAKVTSNGAVNGKTVSDTLFTTGAPLGFDSLDGKLPGCLQYSGYVTYRFKVNQPNFTVEKTVSATGANSYVENVDAAVGATVDFKIKYQNTGTTTQNVAIRDELPAGLEYVNASTYYSSSVTNNQGKAAGHDTVTDQGLGLGAFAPGAGGFVKFSAKVVASDKLVCGKNILKNTASADTENGSKSDTATVTVNKVCEPEKVTACNLKTKQIEQNVDPSKIDNVNYTLDLEKCKEVEKVKACNLDTMKIEENVDPAKIDNVHYTLDLTKCEKKPELVTACNLKTKKIEQNVDKTKIDNVNYTLDLEKCKEIEKVTACNLDTMKIEQNVDPAKIDDVHYTLDLDKCKEEPELVEACNLKTLEIEQDVDASKIDDVDYTLDLTKCDEPETPMCEVPGKEHLPADSEDCAEDEVPEELPHTGLGESFLSVLGLGSIAGATSAYVASRRSLTK